MSSSFELTRAIIQADAQGRFLSENEFKQFENLRSNAETRLDIAKKLTEQRGYIVKTASSLLFEIRADIISPGGNAYGEEMTATCLRDLDYYLRLVTYGLVAGSVDPIDEIGLIGAKEMYQSLNTPIYAMAGGIYAMKIVAASLLSQKEKPEADTYFDYIINYFDDFGKGLYEAIQKIFEKKVNEFDDAQLQQIDSKTKNLYSETHTKKHQINSEAWEPEDYKDFLNLDKLTQQLQKNGVDDQDAFEESAKGFFEAWSRMPSKLKREVWREREVMAVLCEKMNSWKEIPGFLFVGVAQRMIDGKEQLTGILNFEASNLPSEKYYKNFNIPKYLKVESSINDTEDKKPELIPIKLEWMKSPTKYNSSNIKSTITSSETKSSEIASSHVLKLQSGDVIVGRNEQGRFNESKEVTLTAFVFSFDTTGKLIRQVLSVGHGFEAGYEEAYTREIESHKKIGRTYYKSPRQKELAEKLDAALFRIEDDLCDINSHLKWVNKAPEKCIDVRRMPVQMYGGVSKHQTGRIDQYIPIFPGSASSVVPFFTAIISSQPGDSGTLLVSAPDPRNQASYMNEKYSSIENAMLGMLIETSTEGTNGTVSIFRSMRDIFQQLKIQPYLN